MSDSVVIYISYTNHLHQAWNNQACECINWTLTLKEETYYYYSSKIVMIFFAPMHGVVIELIFACLYHECEIKIFSYLFVWHSTGQEERIFSTTVINWLVCIHRLSTLPQWKGTRALDDHPCVVWILSFDILMSYEPCSLIQWAKLSSS